MQRIKKRGKTLYDKLIEELGDKNREHLLSIFKDEVLSYNEGRYLTEDESCRLATYRGRWLALTFEKVKAKEKGDFGTVKAVSKVMKELRKENELLLIKMERAAKMKKLSDRWKKKIEEDFGTTQKISNKKLVEAIAEMRLLQFINRPFDYERYMRTLFRGRQKGRAIKSF